MKITLPNRSSHLSLMRSGQKRTFTRHQGIWLALGLALCTSPDAQAASSTWTGTSADGLWATAGNWTSSTVPGVGGGGTTTNTDTATFTTAGATLPIVIDAGGRNVQNITFDGSGAYTIGAVAGPALLLTSAGTLQTSSTSSGTKTVNAPMAIQNVGAGSSGTYAFAANTGGSGKGLTVGGGITGLATAGNTTTLSLGGSVANSTNVITGIIGNGAAGGKVAVTKAADVSAWTISGVNTYTGGTTVSGGTLAVGNDAALGTGLVTLNGGTLSASGGARTLANDFDLTFTTILGGTNDLTLSGTITNKLPSGRILTISNTGATTLSGPVITSSISSAKLTISPNSGILITISGLVQDGTSAGTLALGGAGTTTLTNANTYTGGTQINAGILAIGNNSALGTGGLLMTSATTLRSSDGTAHTIANPLSNGTAASGGTYTFGATSGGTGDLTLTGTTAFALGTGTASDTFQINNGKTSLGMALTGASGSGLTKAGPGTLALDRTTGSTYTGNTLVSAGKLLVNNTSGSGTGTGTVSVGSGATLGGSGSISGATTLSAGSVLAPGNGVGTLTFTSALTLNNNAAGSLLFDLGTLKDKVTVGGLLTLNGQDFTSFTFDTSGGGFGAGTYILFDASSTIAGSLGSILTSNQFAGYTATLSIDSLNNDLIMQVAVVPEPGTWALVLGGLGVLMTWQRRRKQA